MNRFFYVIAAWMGFLCIMQLGRGQFGWAAVDALLCVAWLGLAMRNRRAA